jgi:hypothetical protein
MLRSIAQDDATLEARESVRASRIAVGIRVTPLRNGVGRQAARNPLHSLWNVPEASTAMLMTCGDV